MILANRNPESRVIQFDSLKGKAAIVYGYGDLSLLSNGKIGLKPNDTVVLELEQKH
jgi:hypothetical protein